MTGRGVIVATIVALAVIATAVALLLAIGRLLG
jgi:hypothetical protein